MNRFTSVSVFFCATGTFLVLCTAAAAQTDSIRSRELGEIRISERKLSRQRLSSVPAQTLSGDDLRKLNSLSVADAIRYFSGIQLKDYGGVGGLKTVNVRSLGTNHTAVFYDGVQLGNAQNGQVDLGRFSLENMDEISLYSAQNPDLLQPARAFASANAIYLKTKAPAFSPGENSRVSARYQTGSFGLVNPSLAIDQRISASVSARFSTALIRADGRYRFRYTNGVYDTTAIRTNGGLLAWRSEASLHGDPDSATSWSLRFYHYQSGRGLPAAVVANRFDASQRQWDDNTFLQGTYRHRLSSAYALLSSAKLGNDFTRYLDPEFTTTTGFLDNRYKQREAYFSLANQVTLLPFWQLALSADYQFTMLDANLYRFVYPRRHTVLANFASQWTFPRISIQAGLLSSGIREAVRMYSSAGNRQKFTPALMLNWQPFGAREFRIRSFYKTIFRMPTFNDLYYTFVGNSFLRPETATQYDFGFTWAKAFGGGIFRTIDLQSDAYYNTVHDKIVAVPGANLFRWTMLNLDRVHIRGLDLNLKTSGKIGPEISFGAGISYTWQQALDATPGSDTFGGQIPYAPEHAGSFTASADRRRIGFSYSFLYTGSRYSQRANIPVNYVEPWYTHDVALRYAISAGKHTMHLAAEVNNLLNQYYDVVLNFPMPGRNYRFSLNYTL